MNEFRLFETLKEAYETTTHRVNRFKNALDRIKWDYVFKTEDDSIMYVIGDFSIEIFNEDGNVNPFTEWLKPSVMFSDNSIISF